MKGKEEKERKRKKEKERYTYLNVEFQRIARRDEKAFLSDHLIKAGSNFCTIFLLFSLHVFIVV